MNTGSTSVAFYDRLKVLFPGILGLALSKAALSVGCFGGYRQTDLGAISEEALLVTLGVFAVVVIVFVQRTLHVSRKNATRFANICVVAAAIFLLAQGCSALLGLISPPLDFAFMVGSALFSSLTMFYWLRRIKGAQSVIAVLYTFGALALSEAAVWLLTLLPHDIALIACGAAALVQLPCIRASLGGRFNSVRATQGNTAYVAVNNRLVYDKLILISNALGIGLFGLVVGFLLGYPDGLPIAFTPLTRICYSLLTIVICAALIYRAYRGSRFGVSIGIWIVLQLCACIALIVFSAVPHDWSYGAVFASTANALLIAWTWYLIVAFESHGWRDPYYYALSGWIVCCGFRSIARLVCHNFALIDGGSLMVSAIVCTILVMSSQVVFTRYLYGIVENRSTQRASEGSHRENGVHTVPIQETSDERNLEEWLRDVTGPDAPEWLKEETSTAASADSSNTLPVADSTYARAILEEMEREHQETTGSKSMQPLEESEEAIPLDRLSRLMGLDKHESFHEKPQPQTQQNELQDRVKQMGEHFLLSERELEVLELYAQGHTQKHVAEELNITPGTAHTYIKRIYSKTGLHSRQDILDFLDNYCN